MSSGYRQALWARACAAPYTAASLGVLLIAAYLCLANLDYVTLWHDEVVVSFLARNLLELGDIIGWDGRNLVGGPDGASLNADLRDMAPPVQYLITAAGFAVFGFNETGARVFHALAGLLALVFFYLILRQQLAKSPRLVFFILLFSAGSAQLLLYLRCARYYSVLVLCMMVGFYLYERWWQGRSLRWLAPLTVVALAAFFNHYASGVAAMLALALWHLLFRGRATTLREWLAFAACGLLAAGLSLAYLVFIGLVGGDNDLRAGFLTVTTEAPPIASLLFLKLWICLRDLFTADWISWPVFLWFVVLAFFTLRRRRHATAPTGNAPRSKRAGGRRPPDTLANTRAAPAVNDELPFAAVSRLLVLGGLCALFTTLLSVQQVWLRDAKLDLRHFVAALPLLLAMKGLFVEWLWRRSRLLGATACATLLFTSAGAAPVNMKLDVTGEPTLGFHLFQFVREIHRPYPTSTEQVSDYLLRYAEQDDFVAGPFYFPWREELVWYTGHRLHFCEALGPDSPLPREKIESLSLPLYAGECDADWVVVYTGLPLSWKPRLAAYELTADLNVFPYTFQRPQLNHHLFESPSTGSIKILRRRSASGRVSAIGRSSEATNTAP